MLKGTWWVGVTVSLSYVTSRYPLAILRQRKGGENKYYILHPPQKIEKIVKNSGKNFLLFFRKYGQKGGEENLFVMKWFVFGIETS